MEQLRILHVLYQSYPNISGSSTRSADLIRAQKEIGLQPIVISSPFQNGISSGSVDLIDDIKYYRTFSGRDSELVSEKNSSFLNKFIKILRILPFTFKLYQIANDEDVDVIHAHAMFFCAIPAKLVSLLTGKKFIYEIRSLWEERSSSSFKRRIIKFIENLAVSLSGRFIVINKNLKAEFVNRGFLPDNIFVVDNAINLDRIKIPEEISFQEKSISELVFGYVGSISPIEGLLYVVDVFSRLRDAGFSNKFIIFGSGIEFDKVSKRISELGLNDQIILKGSFKPADILSIYNQIDIIVNPRVRSQITDSVTPLKPLEAFAFKKLFLGSNVGGIQELVDGKNVGLMFDADNLESFYRMILFCLDPLNKQKLVQLILNGHKYLIEERSWKSNARNYAQIYNLIS